MLLGAGWLFPISRHAQCGATYYHQTGSVQGWHAIGTVALPLGRCEVLDPIKPIVKQLVLVVVTWL